MSITILVKLAKKWNDNDKSKWLSEQAIKRSYQDEVVNEIKNLSIDFDIDVYGELKYSVGEYKLYSIKTKNWDDNKPVILVTGGVHGYETSGVHGALRFANTILPNKYYKKFNILILPCISPWGYETINRWNPLAVDPNRSFYDGSDSLEATNAMDHVKSFGCDIFMHIDLHETTDTDDTEFRLALAARNGVQFGNWGIPDGYYLVADATNIKLGFQNYINKHVAKVTHIAPADNQGKIIGEDVVSEGVIAYEASKLGLCMGFSHAEFSTTTEVYPDSPKTNPEECILAQVATIQSAIKYIQK